ncbi:hypothetical protein [Halomicrococcus sp. SG-WS-1]|uniref:hypothetical protein n=1 Tax=Halomicrococcus sp. SG-WS-1 TaxID=3439057 RepID=UPI003F79E8B9
MDVRNHPDAPDRDALQDIVVEPVAREEIRSRRADGEVLVEDDVREREDLNVVAQLSGRPDASESENIGVALYRLVQLFGTPQFPEYEAGGDISWRTDDTFKYLLRATHRGDQAEIPDEWLMTVYDTHVRLGASVAEWRDEDASFTADAKLALTTFALAQRLAVDPVECVWEEVLY